MCHVFQTSNKTAVVSAIVQRLSTDTNGRNPVFPYGARMDGWRALVLPLIMGAHEEPEMQSQLGPMWQQAMLELLIRQCTCARSTASKSYHYYMADGADRQAAGERMRGAYMLWRCFSHVHALVWLQGGRAREGSRCSRDVIGVQRARQTAVAEIARQHGTAP